MSVLVDLVIGGLELLKHRLQYAAAPYRRCDDGALAAVELFPELTDELPLRPSQSMIVNGNREQALLAPAVSFDFLGQTPLAAVALGKAPCRAAA